MWEEVTIRSCGERLPSGHVGRGYHQVMWEEVTIRSCGERLPSGHVGRGYHQVMWGEVTIRSSGFSDSDWWYGMLMLSGVIAIILALVTMVLFMVRDNLMGCGLCAVT